MDTKNKPIFYRIIYNRDKDIRVNHQNLKNEEICNKCGKKIKKRYAELDHTIPICVGGLIDGGVQILCKDCHIKKTKHDIYVIKLLKEFGFIIKIKNGEYYICTSLSDLFMIYEILFDYVQEGKILSYKTQKLIELGHVGEDYELEIIECNNLNMLEQRKKEINEKRVEVVQNFMEKFYIRSIDSFEPFSIFYFNLLSYLRAENMRIVSRVELGKLLNAVGIEKKFTTLNNKTQLYLLGLKKKENESKS